MSLRVEAASPDQFPAVHDTLLRGLNPELPRQHWERLFVQPWADADDLTGRVLWDGERPVGYVAFIHARPTGPAGEIHHLCNVSSWVVEPSHSRHAPSLIAPILGLRTATITNLTSIRAVHDMFVRLGFSELEASTRILRPTPFASSPWGRAELLLGPDEALEALEGRERTLAADHRDFCRHLVLRERGGDTFYAIYTLGRYRKLPAVVLHWASRDTFEPAAVALRRALFRLHGTLFIRIDRRLAPADLPGSFEVPLEVPRLFRSPDLPAEAVPSAYSEFTLLEF